MTAKHSVPNRALNGDPRDRAATVLVRVEASDAYAAPTLSAAIEREPALSPMQRGLCTELVYGVLRCGPSLDRRLAALTTRAGSYEKLDSYTRAVLRIAAYQLLVLQKIPPHASVNTAVNAIKKDRSVGMGGFANAMLQKVAKQRDESLCESRRIEFAIDSVGPKLRQALTDALGTDADTHAVLKALFENAQKKDLRVETTRATKAQVVESVLAERPDNPVTSSAVAANGLTLSGGGDLRTLTAYREGWIALQEQGAQAIALACDVHEGMSVLDACAGRGGKTAALASALNGCGTLHAVDYYPNKLERISAELDRLHLRGERLSLFTTAADLTRGIGGLKAKVPSGGYDVVLVDAPCSGLGTLGRRPEIMARRERQLMTALDDSDEGTEDTRPLIQGTLVDLQRGILQTVSKLVRPGGTLVYAVCTLTLAEGVQMREWFLREHPQFAPARASNKVSDKLRADVVHLRPDQDGTDGYVFWRVKRAL